eukprot:m.826196 g.826196  ORF g.826196 m.826196 type:complete len:220 (-) comp23410_c0_seq13:2715-3374(-)
MYYLQSGKKILPQEYPTSPHEMDSWRCTFYVPQSRAFLLLSTTRPYVLRMELCLRVHSWLVGWIRLPGKDWLVSAQWELHGGCLAYLQSQQQKYVITCVAWSCFRNIIFRGSCCCIEQDLFAVAAAAAVFALLEAMQDRLMDKWTEQDETRGRCTKASNVLFALLRLKLLPVGAVLAMNASQVLPTSALVGALVDFAIYSPHFVVYDGCKVLLCNSILR